MLPANDDWKFQSFIKHTIQTMEQSLYSTKEPAINNYIDINKVKEDGEVIDSLSVFIAWWSGCIIWDTYIDFTWRMGNEPSIYLKVI